MFAAGIKAMRCQATCNIVLAMHTSNVAATGFPACTPDPAQLTEVIRLDLGFLCPIKWRCCNCSMSLLECVETTSEGCQVKGTSCHITLVPTSMNSTKAMPNTIRCHGSSRGQPGAWHYLVSQSRGVMPVTLTCVTARRRDCICRFSPLFVLGIKNVMSECQKK